MNEIKKARKRVNLIIAYQDTFKTKKGQEVLHDLMKRCHYFHSSFTGNSEETIFREGERNVINMILTELNLSPSEILKYLEKREVEDDTTI